MLLICFAAIFSLSPLRPQPSTMVPCLGTLFRLCPSLSFVTSTRASTFPYLRVLIHSLRCGRHFITPPPGRRSSPTCTLSFIRHHQWTNSPPSSILNRGTPLVAHPACNTSIFNTGNRRCLRRVSRHHLARPTHSSRLEMEMAGPDPEKCLQTHSGHPPHYAHESIAEALDRPHC